MVVTITSLQPPTTATSPYFPGPATASTSRCSPLVSVGTHFAGKSCATKRRVVRSPTTFPPGQGGAHTIRPPLKPGARGAWRRSGFGGLQPFENQGNGRPHPSWSPFLSKAHLTSALTTERPEDPTRDFIQYRWKFEPRLSSRMHQSECGNRQSLASRLAQRITRTPEDRMRD